MNLEYQVFNSSFYGVVDLELLEAHTRHSRLASRMDMNDFLHVSSMYNPRASGSGSDSAIVVRPVSSTSTAASARQPRPAALMPPPSTASSDIVAEDPSTRPSLTGLHDDLSRLFQGRSPIKHDIHYFERLGVFQNKVVEWKGWRVENLYDDFMI